jgi:glutamate synthase domain-containing protein 2/glutamate synthase domain-containing protein 1/glutamate synthase domain-containing protein 3
MTQGPNRQWEGGLYRPQYEHDSCGAGFVVDIKGRRSHKIVEDALTVLSRMKHRGATGADASAGDGAGILTQIPNAFFRRECAPLEIDLPDDRPYAVGMLFLPRDDEDRRFCQQELENVVIDEGQVLLGWRDVPVNDEAPGPANRNTRPVIKQVFITPANADVDTAHFERKLFVIRRWAKELITRANEALAEQFYFASLSTRTIVYKGMLTATQVGEFYPDLLDDDFESSVALIHSRFSTNTFPSWSRAQPLRYIAHNGEINTLRGNMNWMNARENNLRSVLFGDDLQKILHVIDGEASDSGAFDNSLELLTLAGRSLPHTVMMMVPEPLSDVNPMSEEKRAFYEYHSSLIEPWDGPAAITFSDGEVTGAVLDRNGLRPLRYLVTKDGLVVMASEAGVLDIDPAMVEKKGRVEPGKIFLVDTREGRIISDDEFKSRLAGEQPYGVWLQQNLLHINDLPDPPFVHEADHETVLVRQRAHGYTDEDIRIIIEPMARNGEEPIGSMGTDTPLAVLSERPQLLYNYFKQLFAQVTNPPIDAIREEFVTSTDVMIGRDANLLDASPKAVHQIKLNSFVLTNSELEKLRLLGNSESVWGKCGFSAITLPMLFDREHGAQGLEWALDKLCHQAEAAVADGYDIFILSDREMNEYRVPIPALLAVSAVHHHLTRKGLRTQVGFVLESAEPREVHHFALLLGYGATAINPYLAFETIHDQIRSGALELPELKAVRNYTKAVIKGVVKVMSKMGISTIRSYLGAQIFEALGLGEDVVEKYFTRTPTSIGGIGLSEIAEEALARHGKVYAKGSVASDLLETGGNYQWRNSGETHLFDPQTIHSLQLSCRTGDYELFKRYSRGVNKREENAVTLRSLLRFKSREGAPLDEVEPVEKILARFKTGAMSYGSISRQAHESLAVAMNRVGGKSNTGEGGEDQDRFMPDANGDLRMSRIKQVASGRFGVTSHYLVNADEIQIKMAQGAKPGEGGQLPGSKVYPWIAKTRKSMPGVGLISPPPHHDIYSIEDLKQVIFDLKNANDRARISVKLVAEAGVGTVAAGVAKAKADVILISGYDGGTGASPLTGLKHAGVPWEIGLAETHQTLLINNLRSRVRLETDGQLKTGRDVVIAALLGAEEFGFSTAPLVALGCIMMRVCHLNTCPVGIATQDPRLQEEFSGDPRFVENFMRFVALEVRELMARLGFKTFDEMVGRAHDVLDIDQTCSRPKARKLDLARLLFRPDVPLTFAGYQQVEQEHELGKTLDKRELLKICKNAIENGEPVSARMPIRNTDRSVGTILGAEVSRRYGSEGLPADTIKLSFNGTAGQSFGAFLPPGMSLLLEGDANDYVGKGLSGGRIVLRPPQAATFVASDNVIVGNTVLYGATAGEAFIAGMAGERFAVRNSGANAVVEGVGDHGCEYMTGGRVVVLGRTGKNFAAGMSGGVAYVFDEAGEFYLKCNQQMVSLDGLEDAAEIAFVRDLVRRHFEMTDSLRAAKILENWEAGVRLFVRVLPDDYRKVIESQKRFVDQGLTKAEAEMAAFVETVKA